MFSIDVTQINRGETIGVALSGGKDSVCLLHYLFTMREKLGVSLCVINVEHGIRGESSVRDTEFCRDLAENYGLPFYSFSVNALKYAKDNSMSVEESARYLRYESFFDALKRNYCDKIAVAHHLSDNVETILFNLFRGASLSGAKGISAESYDGKIIRPLLNVSAEDIRLYVDKHELSYVFDETNSDTDYTRNALRLDVIPKIKSLFPKMETALSRFSDLAKEDDEYLYSVAEKCLISDGDRYFIPIDLAAPIKKRCVIIALKKLGVSKDYEKVHVDDVVALSSNISGKKICLPRSIIAVREGDNVVIGRFLPAMDKPILPFKLGKIIFNDYVLTFERVESFPSDRAGALYFDGDKIPSGAVIRVKETGDEFTKFGGGKVSLKKYLTDCKFPESKKATTPVIACGKTVFCVCEKDISSLIKIDKSTVNIIKLTCEKQKR